MAAEEDVEVILAIEGVVLPELPLSLLGELGSEERRVKRAGTEGRLVSMSTSRLVGSNPVSDLVGRIALPVPLALPLLCASSRARALLTLSEGPWRKVDDGIG